MKFHCGVPINPKGFVMPTILAFIIITSTAVMYQTLSTIVQLYGVQSEIEDLVKWEYAINTKRVIANLDKQPIEKLNNELNYKHANRSLEIKRSSCYVTPTDSSIAGELLSAESLSLAKYQQFQQDVQSEICNTQQPDSQMYTVLFVDYDLDVLQHRLLIVDENNIMVKNMNVK